MKHRITVHLNGSGENPYYQFGLTQNPFPQSPWPGVDRLLADLAANPIKDVADLRRRLQGCSLEFIEGCVSRFKAGETVTFDIEFES